MRGGGPGPRRAGRWGPWRRRVKRLKLSWPRLIPGLARTSSLGLDDTRPRPPVSLPGRLARDALVALRTRPCCCQLQAVGT